MIPKWSEAGNQIRTDNTMAIRYQRCNQKPGIKEEQTIQWPKDTKRGNQKPGIEEEQTI